MRIKIHKSWDMVYFVWYASECTHLRTSLFSLGFEMRKEIGVVLVYFKKVGLGSLEILKALPVAADTKVYFGLQNGGLRSLLDPEQAFAEVSKICLENVYPSLNDSFYNSMFLG